jgi:hypothetical protein
VEETNLDLDDEEIEKMEHHDQVEVVEILQVEIMVEEEIDHNNNISF